MIRQRCLSVAGNLDSVLYYSLLDFWAGEHMFFLSTGFDREVSDWAYGVSHMHTLQM